MTILSIQDSLADYKQQLQREQENKQRPIIISLYADAIGRCYEQLDQQEEMKEYTTLAKNQAVESLDSQLAISHKPDIQGDAMLWCARMFWRDRDALADSYFKETLNILEAGYQWEYNSVRGACWYLAFFAYVFIENYSQAEEALEMSFQNFNSQKTKKKNPNWFLETALNALISNQREALQEAISVIEKELTKSKTLLYSSRPSILVELLHLLYKKEVLSQS